MTSFKKISLIAALLMVGAAAPAMAQDGGVAPNGNGGSDTVGQNVGVGSFVAAGVGAGVNAAEGSDAVTTTTTTATK